MHVISISTFFNDFLRQNNSKNFRDFEKCEYLHNQAMNLKFKGTIRKPTKFIFRQYFNNLPVDSDILEKFEFKALNPCYSVADYGVLQFSLDFAITLMTK